jgi:hypothetical protein
MKKRSFLAIPVLLLFLCVGVVGTSIGPRLLLRVAAELATPWNIVVTGQSGSLLRGFTWRNFRLYNGEVGIELRVAELSISLLPWAVVLDRPLLNVDMTERAAEAEAGVATGIELPLAWLPTLDIVDGRIDCALSGGTYLHGEKWSASYRRAEKDRGVLSMAVGAFSTVVDSQDINGQLSTVIGLYPTRIAVDSLRAQGRVGLAHADIEAAGQLGLEVLRPLVVRLRASLAVNADSLAVDMDVEGALEPLAIKTSLRGVLAREEFDEIAFTAEMRAEPGSVLLDSFEADVFAGTLRATASYDLVCDSLGVALRAERLALTRVDSSLGGWLSGVLEADIDLAEMRYRGTLDIEAEQVQWPGVRVFAADLHIDHSADGFTRGQLRSGPVDLLATGRSDMAGAYDLELEGQLRPQYITRMELAPVSLRGGIRPDSLHVDLSAKYLDGLGNRFGPLQAELYLRQMRYLNAQMQWEEGLLRASASIDLQEMMADSITVAVRSSELDRVVPGLEGTLSIDLRAAGPLRTDALQASAQLAARNLIYSDWHAGSFAATADWRDGAGVVAVDGNRVAARVATHVEGGLEARAEFAGTVLRGAAAGDSLGLVGTLDYRGPIDLDRGRASLFLRDLALSVGGVALASAAPVQLDYSPLGLALGRVDLKTPLGVLAVSGTAAADSLALKLRMPQIQLQQVAPYLAVGSGTAEVAVGGSLAHPTIEGWIGLRALELDTLALGDLRVDLALRDSLQLSAELERAGHKEAVLALTAPAASLWGGSSAGVARLHLLFDQLSLQGPLTYALGEPVRGALDLWADLVLPIDRVDSSFSWGAIEGDLSLNELVIDAEVDGDSLHIELRPGAYMRSGGGEVSLDSLRVEMSRYDRDADLFIPAGALELAGRLPATGEADLQLGLRDVDLVFFGGPEGTADVRAGVTGTENNPQLAALLEIDTDDLGQLQGQWDGNRDGVAWHLNWTTLLEDSLVVDGHLPWDLDAGRIGWDAGWLKAQSEGFGLLVFSDHLVSLDHFDGRLGIDVQARGLDSTLTLDGRIDFADMEFALVDVAPMYSLPQGSLVFADRRGDLHGFSAEATSLYDEFELAGSIDLSSVQDPRFDVQVRFEGLDCRYEDIFRADDISAALRMTGTPLSSRLSGWLRLDKPLAEPVLVVLNAPPVPPPPPALRDEFLENMELDVHVDIRNLEVDSELAKAKASGGIGIAGTFYKPIFQGDIIVEEGQVFILNREFELQQSRVVLNSLVPTRSLLEVAYDPLELNPDLDLRATTTVVDIDPSDLEEYTVTMTVQGPAKSAVPNFQSTPSLVFSDIMSLLAFGSASSRGNYGTILGAAAGQLLSKHVESVGIDEFAVLPSSAIIGAKPGDPALRMGKYLEIPFPMWVRYEAAVNEMSQGEVRLEHRVNSILTLTGSAQSEYDRYGLGIGLRKEF